MDFINFHKNNARKTQNGNVARLRWFFVHTIKSFCSCGAVNINFRTSSVTSMYHTGCSMASHSGVAFFVLYCKTPLALRILKFHTVELRWRCFCVLDFFFHLFRNVLVAPMPLRSPFLGKHTKSVNVLKTNGKSIHVHVP